MREDSCSGQGVGMNIEYPYLLCPRFLLLDLENYIIHGLASESGWSKSPGDL